MKKLSFCLFFAVILLVGCSKPRNMKDVVNEPNFSGIVDKVYEQSILVRVNEDEDAAKSSDLISVSLVVALKDSMTDFEVGDEVRVYYHGSIEESYPAQVNKAYGIIPVD